MRNDPGGGGTNPRRVSRRFLGVASRGPQSIECPVLMCNRGAQIVEFPVLTWMNV
jgi:hypothetical protein